MSKAGTIEYDVKIKLSDFTAQAKQLDKAASAAAKSSGDAIDKNINQGAERASAGLLSLSKTGAVAFAGIVAGAATAGKTLWDGIKEYANFEQLTGGVETLFKDSSGELMKYAQAAYRTANLSANEYMETATSFSASLLQGLGGDTAKAAKLADIAITDMADNANKFGTDIGLIQNAYQGFAKQNYTMLDNLKLGYGGTQEEMARLINDSKVMNDGFVATAKNINQVPFHKLIEGIHKTQEKMGITGTTVKESSETMSGSWAMLSSSWRNLLAGVEGSDKAFGESLVLIGRQVVDKVPNIAKNIADGLWSGIGTAISESAKSNSIVNSIATGLTVAKDSIELLITGNFGGDMFAGMFNEDDPVIDSILKVRDSVKGVFEDMHNSAKPFIDFISANIKPAFEWMGEFLKDKLGSAFSGFSKHLGGVMPLLKKLGTIFGVVAGVVGATLFVAITTAIHIFGYLAEAIGHIAGFAVGILIGGFNFVADVLLWLGGVIKGTADFFVSAWKFIVDTWNAAPGFFGGVIDGIKNFFGGIGNWISGKFRDGWNAVTGLWSGIGKWFGDLGGGMIEAGKNVIDGLIKGISNGKDAVINKIKDICKGALDQVKNFFGIKSPSRVMAEMGGHLMTGFEMGIARDAGRVADAMGGVNKNIMNALPPNITTNLGVNASVSSRAVGYNPGGRRGGNQIYQTFNQYIGDGVTLDQVNRASKRQARRYV